MGDLRAATSHLPDNILVVQARDPEGNGFAPVFEIEVGKYLNDNYDSGMIHPDDVSEYDDLVDAVCLWPVH